MGDCGFFEDVELVLQSNIRMLLFIGLTHLGTTVGKGFVGKRGGKYVLGVLFYLEISCRRGGGKMLSTTSILKWLFS